MLKRAIILTVVLGLVVALNPVAAAKPAVDNENTLPDQDGVYDVPGHANLKLQVIVYHGKPAEKSAKPGPAPAPQLQCNLPDLDSSAVVAPAGWVMPASWTYRLNPSSVPATVGKNNAATIAVNAFAQWNSAVNGAVSIMRLPDTSANRAQYDGQNIIAWGRTSGTALATTYIWYDTSISPYKVMELDTIMNQKFSWAWADPAVWQTSAGTTCAYQGVYDAQDILTHELGHWYGLNDEYTGDYVNNTMYGYGSPGQSNADTLTAGDILGVKALY